jgi:hypothetical protein
MSRSSAGLRSGITLSWVVEPVDITPEPDEDEREAIIAALAAADAATQPAASDWADGVLPGRDGEDGAPYPQ